MEETNPNYTEVTLYERQKKTYTIHKALGGLIKWQKLLKTDSLGMELHIRTTEKYDRIYLNGEELKSEDKSNDSL